MEHTKDNSLAMELLLETKKTIKRQWQFLIASFIVIGIMAILLAGTNLYHIYQWSQFDRVSLDSNDGGNASYIGNDGEVNNYGESSSTQTEEE